MSQVSRRNGATPENQSYPDSISPSPERQLSLQSTSRPSPYLLLIYPIILAIGVLFSVISPSASLPAYSPPLTPGIASNIHTPKTADTPNYFARKQNILNIYFVKVGWFWTTIAFVLLQLTTALTTTTTTTTTTTDSPRQQHPATSTTNHHTVKALLRYSLVTLSWVLTTQWFFGPALTDRSFTSTGGRCLPGDGEFGGAGTDGIDLSGITTSLSCKYVGGEWRGGHDVSGHFFILVLSSAFLFLEFFLSEKSHSRAAHPHISPSAAARIVRETSEDEEKEEAEKKKKKKKKKKKGAVGGGWESEEEEEEEGVKARLWTWYLIWTVILLDGWMLLMTAIWFHTLFEKMSGLSLASLTIWAVYFLPRSWPAWRRVIGGV